MSNNIADKDISGSSYSIGGGLTGYTTTTKIHAYNCLIIDNQADRGGGVGDFSVLSNCTISLNKVPYSDSFGLGGGVYGGTAASLTDCVVSNNTGGGAVYRTFTTNCVIVANSGSAAIRPHSLVNSLVYGNGGGLALDQTWLTEWLVESCTIVGNAGRGLDVTKGNVYSRNNIIYGNQTDNWRQSAPGTITFENTCTTPAQDGWDASNLTADPKLVDPGSGYGASHVVGNYRLRGDSPCLNKGAILPWMTGALDLDDNPRIDQLTGIPDMGCFEHVYRGTVLLLR